MFFKFDCVFRQPFEDFFGDSGFIHLIGRYIFPDSAPFFIHYQSYRFVGNMRFHNFPVITRDHEYIWR